MTIKPHGEKTELQGSCGSEEDCQRCDIWYHASAAPADKKPDDKRNINQEKNETCEIKEQQGMEIPDEIFFLDLPTVDERMEICNVHIRKRHRLPIDYDISKLALLSEGYVGAEIEQAIIDAMYIGFNEEREFTTQDIMTSLRRLVPLSVSQREIIERLRSWLREGRAQSASFGEVQDAVNQFVPLMTEGGSWGFHGFTPEQESKLKLN